MNFCAQWKKEYIIQSMKYSWTTIYTNTSMLDIDKKKITLCFGLHRVCRSVEKTSPKYEQVLNMKISREELGRKLCSTD